MSDGDPAVLEPRGKSNAARKGRYDGALTGTEQRTKDRLMRQFMKTGEGPGGNSDAYRNASCWCACGKLKGEGDSALCVKCRAAATEADEIAFFPQNSEREPMGCPHARAVGVWCPHCSSSPPEPFDVDGSIFRRGR